MSSYSIHPLIAMEFHRHVFALTLAHCLFVFLTITAHAQNIFVVNSIADTPDNNPGNGNCRTAAGVCTLRAAIEEANATPNGASPDVIVFTTIPMVSGRAEIAVIGSAMPMITEAVVIDGTSAAGEVVLDGTGQTIALPFHLGGLTFGAGSDGSTVRRLTIGNFPHNGIYLDSHNHVVVKTRIGVRADGTDMGNGWSGIYVWGDNNIIGRPDLGNIVGFNALSGIKIFEGDSNVVMSNYVGTNNEGADFGNGPDTIVNAYAGISVDGIGNLIGGPLSGQGNTIGFNTPSGIRLQRSETENIIRGNYIGTDAAGRDLGNFDEGILIYDGSHTIGGSSPGMGNTIGFNTTGIRVETSDNKIQGNYIGTNAAGVDLGNEDHGIYITYDASHNLIGNSVGGDVALNPDRTNHIAFNGVGIAITEDGSQRNTIRGNAFYDNDTAGIDLEDDGATLNDTDDSDWGPNLLLNYPDVTRAFYRPGSDAIVVELSVSTAAGQAYSLTIDAYLSDDAASGEGKTFIGSYSYATSGAVVQWEIPAAGIAWDPLDYVVLTATDTLGNTSEFSPAQGPLDPLAVVGAQGGLVDTGDLGDRMEGEAMYRFSKDGLGEAYPNPFNPRTAFTLSLAEASPAHVAVYDALGRQVALLHDGKLSASTHTFTFDAAGLATGVYLLRVQTSRFVESRRLMLVK